MKNPIKTFAPNTVGRDFVIGDLHGSLSSFENLLKNLYFDKTKDRMFSVGDLVDRGPDSLGCLELLYEPWFHSVLSNHEQMMLEAFKGGPNFWFQNGGAWGITAKCDWDERANRIPMDDSTRVFSTLPHVLELPYLITVNMVDGKKFHIIHAELPPNKILTDEVLADPNAVLEYSKIQTENGEFYLWGRYLFMQFFDTDMSNKAKLIRTLAHSHRNSIHFFNDKLSHIISGHTIVRHPLTILGQTNIDTGAYNAYDKHAKSYDALTCVELASWKFYQATENTFKEVQPVVITAEDVNSIRLR